MGKRDQGGLRSQYNPVTLGERRDMGILPHEVWSNPLGKIVRRVDSTMEFQCSPRWHLAEEVVDISDNRCNLPVLDMMLVQDGIHDDQGITFHNDLMHCLWTKKV